MNGAELAARILDEGTHLDQITADLLTEAGGVSDDREFLIRVYQHLAALKDHRDWSEDLIEVNR